MTGRPPPARQYHSPAAALPARRSLLQRPHSLPPAAATALGRHHPRQPPGPANANLADVDDRHSPLGHGNDRSTHTTARPAPWATPTTAQSLHENRHRPPRSDRPQGHPDAEPPPRTPTSTPRLHTNGRPRHPDSSTPARARDNPNHPEKSPHVNGVPHRERFDGLLRITPIGMDANEVAHAATSPPVATRRGGRNAPVHTRVPTDRRPYVGQPIPSRRERPAGRPPASGDSDALK